MAIRRPMKRKLLLGKPEGGSSRGGRGHVLKVAEEHRRAREAHLIDDEIVNSALKVMGLEERFGAEVASSIMESFSEYMEGQHHKLSREALIVRLAAVAGSYEIANGLAKEFIGELRLVESKIRGR